VTTYLLDVNVLLALSDPLHVHQAAAARWMSSEGESWATCPITENGFMRISSHPNYANRPGGVETAAQYLLDFRGLAGWRFWADDVSILDVLELDATITHSQITDLYLLGLAAHKGGKLATLDNRINATAVRGGREALFVIPVG
jgi:hypothetical protein